VIFLRTFVSLLVLAVTGAGLAAILFPGGRRRGLLEFLGLSYILGFGTVGLVSVVLMMAGARIGWFLAPVLAVAGGMALLWRRPRELRLPEFSPGALGPLLVLSLALAVGLWGVLARRNLGYDADAFWSLKAKSLARYGTFRNPDFTVPGTRPHMGPGYPLLVPAVHAWIYWGTGSMEGGPLRMAMFLFFAASLAILWSALREAVPPVPCGWLTAAFALIPAVQTGDSGGAGGWCDYPLAIFLLIAVLAAGRWLQSGAWSSAGLSSLALCFVSLTKMEGALIAGLGLILLAVAGGMRYGLRGAGLGVAIAAPALLLAVAWAAAREVVLPDPMRDWGSIRRGIYWDRLPDILLLTASHMLRFKEWGIAWLALGAALALQIRAVGRAGALPLWFGLGLIALYVAIWMAVPGESARAAMQDNKKRLLLQAFPLFFVWAAWRLPALGLVPAAAEDVPAGR